MPHLALLTFLAVTLGAGSAAAQEGGSPARRDSDVDMNDQRDELIYEQGFRKDPASAAEAYRVALRFAGCAARRDPRAARELLASDAGSAAEGVALTAVARRHRACVATRLAMPATIFRGAFAETAWAMNGSVANPRQLTKVDMSDIQSFFRAPPLGEVHTRAGRLPLSWVARCQVMALPSMAARLIATAPGSNEERAAVTALYARSGVCGIDRGVGDMVVAYARSSVADALYQNLVRSKGGESS